MLTYKTFFDNKKHLIYVDLIAIKSILAFELNSFRYKKENSTSPG